jgi:N-acetylglucosaminylphosphatidylinositol deacetylase
MSPPSYILVIAHPDDESMFFAPTLLSLENVSVICLSNGNYNGLGRIREKELDRACEILGVQRVTCCSDALLEDNPRIPWEAKEIARVLRAAVQESKMEGGDIIVLTFDERGVSGHPNHIDTYRGVQYWLSLSTSKNIRGFKLKTISNPFFKYIPPVWLLYGMFGRESPLKHYVCYKPWLVWKAMAAHASQFVWYRRLSVVFSCYTYHNQWHEMEHDSKS